MKRCVAIICLAFVAVLAGAAQARPPLREGKVDGTISALSAAGQTVTITPNRPGSAAVTLQVTAATRIEHGDFSSLVVGQRVDAKYDPAAMVATKIKIHGGPGDHDEKIKVDGRIITISPATTSGPGQVMLDLNGDGTPDLTLTIDTNTEVRLGDVTLTGDQLSLLRGLVAKVEYGQDSLVARKIEVKIPGAEQLILIGQVTAVDTTAGALTVQPAAGSLVTFLVLPGVKVEVNGHPTTLAGVLVGQTAQVLYTRNADGVNLALSVRATAPPPPRPVKVDGTLTAVDSAGGTFTMTTRTGSITLTVGPGTDLKINGRRSTLADLAAALTAAQASGRPVKIKAKYVPNGAVNQATEVKANVHGRGIGHSGGDDDQGDDDGNGHGHGNDNGHGNDDGHGNDNSHGNGHGRGLGHGRN